MGRIPTLAKALVVMGGLATFPITINTTTGRLVASNLNCQDGDKCCPEYKSVCLGCGDPSCMVADYYWRTDGKKCSEAKT